MFLLCKLIMIESIKSLDFISILKNFLKLNLKLINSIIINFPYN